MSDELDRTDARSQWACRECGYKPWLSEIDEHGADECPECGASTAPEADDE